MEKRRAMVPPPSGDDHPAVYAYRPSFEVASSDERLLGARADRNGRFAASPPLGKERKRSWTGSRPIARAQATPSLRLRLSGATARLSERASGLRRAQFRPRTLRLAAYMTVFALMLSLPQLHLDPAVASGASAADQLPAGAGELGVERASPVSRAREVLTQARVPQTLTSQVQADPEIQTYTVQDGDTLITIAKLYAVKAITIAYNNNVTDATLIHRGDVFRIPPFDAAIYTVKAGDTIDSVAQYFKVDAKSIMDANRLYYEPDKFLAGKEILVPEPTATYPNFELKDAKRYETPTISSTPVDTRTLPKPAGKLSWPVGGIITQYFWYGHKGVDIAAPFGTGIAASDAGVVSAAGWVAVGGLRVCVKHSWGMETCYYHTSVVLVDVGQQVGRGQIIARIGLTGVTTGPHVHWEARYQGVLVDPLQY